MLLYIIRHGDPIYAPDSLTPKGKLQAEALAKRLALHGIDEIYASPLHRAQMTAQPTADLLNKEIHIEEWTSENLAYQSFSVINDNGERHWIFHLDSSLLHNDETLKLSFDNWYEADVIKTYSDSNTFKEGYERIQNESDKFLKRLGYERNGAVYNILEKSQKRIAVFCHQGFGVTWLSHLLNIPPHIFWTGFDLSHSSVTIINFSNASSGVTVPKCLCMSDLSHIYREGLPFEYNNSIKL